MFYTQEQIDRANQADLVSFLQSQGEQLTRAGNEYRWKRHDSLTVRGSKWYRHSQSKGGGPVDFVMEFFGKSFTEAVELLTGEKGAAPPPDRPCPASLSDFRLPPPNNDNRTARNYLTAARRIDEDVVLSLVSEMLKAIAEYAKHDRAEFVRVVQEAQSSQQTAEVKKQRTRLATAKQRVSELEVLLCKIYEDNILGKLSDSRYATLDAQYEKEQSELTAEISVLEKAVKSYEKHEKDADRFIALIGKYENFDKLTIAMLNEFIEKILVHERDRKGSIQTTQEVEIYFNFVGRFVPPAFGEVELTPEELEEIRKREERKDRLHQNYLKRKASGAQKRYEDKIKERKKAEIEAKKAAIRAEDIAKGVFVPVSSLPQREPMKGVQSA